MADADEDTPRSLPGISAPDGDLDDETQDFRFLSIFANSKDQSKLPKRGDKDFEPHGSVAQSEALAGARLAMHTALQGGRVHQPKNHMIGLLDAETGNVLVRNAKGMHFRTLGKGEREGVRLLPEEALYLLERGSLDVRWVLDETEQNKAGEKVLAVENGETPETGSKGEDKDLGIPVSLQAAYALLIGKQGLTLERYLVYTGLRRSGYMVLRAPGWKGVEVVPTSKAQSAKEQPWSLLSFALSHLRSRPKEPPLLGPLVRPGLYRNYQDMYRRLSLIPFHDSSTPTAATITATRSSNSSISASTKELERPRVIYYVYKPNPAFAKSRPGPPDFYLAVVSARESTTLTLPDIDSLFADVPPPEKPSQSHPYERLKRGWQSVIVAVVDSGVVSYLRFSEGGFGHQKLFESIGMAGRRGGKSGGRRKWKGKGKGRG